MPENIGFPVQETSRKETSSELDPRYYTTPLSIEETPNNALSTECSISRGLKVSEENNATSADGYKCENVAIDKTQETNVDDSLGGNCATEDHGPDHQTCMKDSRDYTDVSCSGANSNASKEFEDKSKIFKKTSTKDNGSTDLPQDSNVEGVMRLDDTTVSFALKDDTPIVLVSEDISAVVLEQHNVAPEGHRSNNCPTEIFESGHNGDVGCRLNDETVAHHGVNNNFPVGSQTRRNVSTDRGCNQSTDIHKTDDRTNTGSKKRKKPKCSGNNISKDRNPENNISSGHGEDNNGRSYRRPNSEDHTLATDHGVESQPQALAFEKSPNVLPTTSPTCLQQDGSVQDDPVSLPCGSENPTSSGTKKDKGRDTGRFSRVYKTLNETKGLWNALTILLMISLWLPSMAATPAQGRGVTVPLNTQWQQSWINNTNGSFFNQTLNMKNLKDVKSKKCSFRFTVVPFYYECSSEFWIFVKNETSLEILTKYLSVSIEHFILEYGIRQDPRHLPAARGGLLNESSVKAKISEYMNKESATSSPLLTPDEDNRLIPKIVGGVFGALLLLFALVFWLLYKFHPEFRSWVKNVVCCCRRGSRNTPENGPRAPENDSNPDPSAVPFVSVSFTNGRIN